MLEAVRIRSERSVERNGALLGDDDSVPVMHRVRRHQRDA